MKKTLKPEELQKEVERLKSEGQNAIYEAVFRSFRFNQETAEKS